MLIKVSIPFKRESIYKVGLPSSNVTVDEFQFPSNGKAYTKDNPDQNNTTLIVVSIPFKRESIYKEPPF